MILYTMMPHELIFPCDENEFTKLLEVTYDGIPLMVEKMDDDYYRVVRIMSTDPGHYLDTRYMPGAKISLGSIVR